MIYFEFIILLSYYSIYINEYLLINESLTSNNLIKAKKKTFT